MSEAIKIGIESKAFDNFSLDCYRNCPEYYHNRIVRGVIKPGAKKTAADFGTCIHLALEHYYKNGMTDASIQEAMNLFLSSFEPLQDDTDDKRSLGKGLEILGKYFARYRNEPFNVIDTEVGGAVELGEYLYTFRIDLITEWFSPKGIYSFDHKTTSSLSRMVVKPHNQVSGYVYVLQQHYENVLGFILNCIGVYKATEEMDKSAPKIPSPKTGKLIYATKEREVLVRMPTSRTQVEVDQWKKETLYLIKQVEDSQRSNIWPRKTNFCTAYAAKCQYLDLCQAQDPSSILQPLIDAEVFRVDEWQPYKNEGEIVEEE
jgi:PD-(D/E)XK nuclease superfamily